MGVPPGPCNNGICRNRPCLRNSRRSKRHKKAVIKSKNIDEYNTMLTPVVMNDPDPFDDITKANKISLSTFPFGLF